jgi:hypothetical protein
MPNKKMNKKTVGAWLIHHTHKLHGVALEAPDYDQIAFAGKCGIVLNALARSTTCQLSNDRINALAKANGISVRLELPAILTELQKQRLIDKSDKGISILGLTTSQTLEYTATVFEESSPAACEKAAIDLSEKASEMPVEKKIAAEYISDTYRLAAPETSDILGQCEHIGFFDSENVSGEQVYFNGNLFRRDSMSKAKAVVASLSAEDEKKVLGLCSQLEANGCIAKPQVVQQLGDMLYKKLCSIGFIDENSIGNEKGTFSFVTRPAAFTKFTNSLADDAFDLAKAFVTSLTYGMTGSGFGRGRIIMISALMKKLIAGSWIGPATAIGQDYKVLELRGVVEVKPTGDGRFHMRLLKREVGELALAVITEGEASTTSLLELPTVSATQYHGPETNRSILRRRQAEPLKKGVAKLLSDLRTGSLRG